MPSIDVHPDFYRFIRDSAAVFTDVLQSLIILTGGCPGMVNENENIGS